MVPGGAACEPYLVQCSLAVAGSLQQVENKSRMGLQQVPGISEIFQMALSAWSALQTLGETFLDILSY